MLRGTSGGHETVSQSSVVEEDCQSQDASDYVPQWLANFVEETDNALQAAQRDFDRCTQGESILDDQSFSHNGDRSCFNNTDEDEIVFSDQQQEGGHAMMCAKIFTHDNDLVLLSEDDTIPHASPSRSNVIKSTSTSSALTHSVATTTMVDCTDLFPYPEVNEVYSGFCSSSNIKPQEEQTFEHKLDSYLEPLGSEGLATENRKVECARNDDISWFESVRKTQAVQPTDLDNVLFASAGENEEECEIVFGNDTGVDQAALLRELLEISTTQDRVSGEVCNNAVKNSQEWHEIIVPPKINQDVNGETWIDQKAAKVDLGENHCKQPSSKSLVSLGNECSMESSQDSVARFVLGSNNQIDLFPTPRGTRKSPLCRSNKQSRNSAKISPSVRRNSESPRFAQSTASALHRIQQVRSSTSQTFASELSVTRSSFGAEHAIGFKRSSSVDGNIMSPAAKAKKSFFDNSPKDSLSNPKVHQKDHPNNSLSPSGTLFTETLSKVDPVCVPSPVAPSVLNSVHNQSVPIISTMSPNLTPSTGRLFTFKETDSTTAMLQNSDAPQSFFLSARNDTNENNDRVQNESEEKGDFPVEDNLQKHVQSVVNRDENSEPRNLCSPYVSVEESEPQHISTIPFPTFCASNKQKFDHLSFNDVLCPVLDDQFTPFISSTENNLLHIPLEVNHLNVSIKNQTELGNSCNDMDRDGIYHHHASAKEINVKTFDVLTQSHDPATLTSLGLESTGSEIYATDKKPDPVHALRLPIDPSSHCMTALECDNEVVAPLKTTEFDLPTCSNTVLSKISCTNDVKTLSAKMEELMGKSLSVLHKPHAPICDETGRVREPSNEANPSLLERSTKHDLKTPLLSLTDNIVFRNVSTLETPDSELIECLYPIEASRLSFDQQDISDLSSKGSSHIHMDHEVSRSNETERKTGIQPLVSHPFETPRQKHTYKYALGRFRLGDREEMTDTLNSKSKSLRFTASSAERLHRKGTMTSESKIRQQSHSVPRVNSSSFRPLLANHNDEKAVRSLATTTKQLSAATSKHEKVFRNQFNQSSIDRLAKPTICRRIAIDQTKTNNIASSSKNLVAKAATPIIRSSCDASHENRSISSSTKQTSLSSNKNLVPKSYGMNLNSASGRRISHLAPSMMKSEIRTKGKTSFSTNYSKEMKTTNSPFIKESNELQSSLSSKLNNKAIDVPNLRSDHDAKIISPHMHKMKMEPRFQETKSCNNEISHDLIRMDQVSQRSKCNELPSDINSSIVRVPIDKASSTAGIDGHRNTTAKQSQKRMNTEEKFGSQAVCLSSPVALQSPGPNSAPSSLDRLLKPTESRIASIKYAIDLRSRRNSNVSSQSPKLHPAKMPNVSNNVTSTNRSSENSNDKDRVELDSHGSSSVAFRAPTTFTYLRLGGSVSQSRKTRKASVAPSPASYSQMDNEIRSHGSLSFQSSINDGPAKARKRIHEFMQKKQLLETYEAKIKAATKASQGVHVPMSAEQGLSRARDRLRQREINKGKEKVNTNLKKTNILNTT